MHDASSFSCLTHQVVQTKNQNLMISSGFEISQSNQIRKPYDLISMVYEGAQICLSGLQVKNPEVVGLSPAWFLFFN